MPVLERYLGALDALQSQVALDSLTNIADSDKNAFGFGKAAGVLEGVRAARAMLDKILAEQEAEDSERGHRRTAR